MIEKGYPKTVVRRSHSLSLPEEHRGKWFLLWTPHPSIPPNLGFDPVPYDSMELAWAALDQFKRDRAAEIAALENTDG